MRIGVLTYHTSINYGAVMQCYSLSKRLKKEFPDAEVEVIDYRMPKIEDYYNVTYSKLLLNINFTQNLINLILNPKLVKQSRLKKQAFDITLKDLPLSPDVIYDDGVSALFDYINKRYDIVIAGSDAIWNYNLRGYPNPYFLSERINGYKLSYAASCYGMSYENIPDSQRSEICGILDTYSLLGVRDDESESFVKGLGCKTQTIHTCDPTCFLDVNDLPVDEGRVYSIIEKNGGDLKKPFVGVMGGNRMCLMVRSILGNDYQIVSLYNYCRFADLNLMDLNPYEWAYIFRLFKITFTTYFHGTLLSLRNGTPVIAIALKSSYSKNHKTKVEDFLERVGMKDCYFSTDYKNDSISEIKQKVNYFLEGDYKSSILERMDLEAHSSISFFQRMHSILNV